MSGCIKNLYDYDLIKKCNRCGNISLKSNFHKRLKSTDGLQSQCIPCIKTYYLDNRDRIKQYYVDNQDRLLNKQKLYDKLNRDKINTRLKEYIRKRRNTDLDFKSAHNIIVGTNKAFKSQNVRKINKTSDLLGCSHSFFQRWIIHQLYGYMTIENYGSVWQIDHCSPITSFNLLDENGMKKCFNWINLRPMYSNKNISKGSKIDNRL